MYKKMLVPLDGSNVAEIEFEYAMQLARRLNLDPIFMNVCDPEEAEMAPMHRAYINQIVEIASRDFGDVKTTASFETRGRAPKARGEMVVGKPEQEVLRLAEKHNVDLILMSTHGHSGIGVWGVGSVALRVLSTSTVPVWLVPATVPGEIVHNEWPDTRFLVALDGSKMAEAVLPHVEAVARQRGGELVEVILLRVYEPAPIPSDTLKSTISPKPKSDAVPKVVESLSDCEDYLRGVEKRLRDAGLKVQSETVVGDPASEIINYAQGHPFNLVFLSTCGRSGRAQLPYGSVAGKVLKRISSPIFVVRPSQKEC
ncbi:MAG: universal stress protein [Dehalococcoidia bacterium]|nr:universal stress protein [Dehalococcoidia bacterium]